MSNEIEIFKNPSFGNIRVQKDEEGEPLFCLADVCRALELTNPAHTANQICEEFSIPTLDVGMVTRPDGSSIQANFITEQQLYFVMNRSDKPNAKPFRMWVNTVVLPSIRKTGSYSIKSPVDTIVYSSDPLERSRALTKVLEEERAKQELITKERDDARDLVKDVVQDNTTYTATEIAKDLGLRSAIELNKWLVDIGFMYKSGKSYLPYAEFSKMGLTSHKLYDTGNGFNVKTVKFTNLGKMWIVEKWKELHNTCKDMFFLLEGNKPN